MINSKCNFYLFWFPIVTNVKIRLTAYAVKEVWKPITFEPIVCWSYLFYLFLLNLMRRTVWCIETIKSVIGSKVMGLQSYLTTWAIRHIFYVTIKLWLGKLRMLYKKLFNIFFHIYYAAYQKYKLRKIFQKYCSYHLKKSLNLFFSYYMDTCSYKASNNRQKQLYSQVSCNANQLF